MPLNLKSRLEDEFGIIELSGSLTLGPTLVTLREVARQQVNTHKLRGVILSLADVTVTDSAGLGELSVVYTLASSRRCPLRLVHVSQKLHSMLEMTRLDAILPTAKDVPTAKLEMKGN